MKSRWNLSDRPNQTSTHYSSNDRSNSLGSPENTERDSHVDRAQLGNVSPGSGELVPILQNQA